MTDRGEHRDEVLMRERARGETHTGPGDDVSWLPPTYLEIEEGCNTDKTMWCRFDVVFRVSRPAG